jgi:hypothetical protein
MEVTRVNAIPTRTTSFQAFPAPGSLIYRLFLSKQHESWTHVILLLGFGVVFGHKETTETQAT